MFPIPLLFLSFFFFLLLFERVKGTHPPKSVAVLERAETEGISLKVP